MLSRKVKIGLQALTNSASIASIASVIDGSSIISRCWDRHRLDVVDDKSRPLVIWTLDRVTNKALLPHPIYDVLGHKVWMCHVDTVALSGQYP